MARRPTCLTSLPDQHKPLLREWLFLYPRFSFICGFCGACWHLFQNRPFSSKRHNRLLIRQYNPFSSFLTPSSSHQSRELRPPPLHTGRSHQLFKDGTAAYYSATTGGDSASGHHSATPLLKERQLPRFSHPFRLVSRAAARALKQRHGPRGSAYAPSPSAHRQ